MLGIRIHSILYQYDDMNGMELVKRRKITNKGELPAPHIATARPQSAEPNPTEFIDTRDTLELHHSELPGDSLYEPEMTDNMPLNSSEQMFIVESESGKLSQDSPKKYSKISKTQMKEFREAFGFFDKDGDGSITKDELGIVMRSLGQFASEEELKEMLKEVDINGDGTFSFDEFVQIVTNYSGGTSVTDEEQELRDAFRIFDKHNRGYISASDLRAVLHCLGEDLSEDEIEDMIKEVDVDGDGRIDFNEFVRALGEPDSDEEEGDSPFTFAQPI